MLAASRPAFSVNVALTSLRRGSISQETLYASSDGDDSSIVEANDVPATSPVQSTPSAQLSARFSSDLQTPLRYLERPTVSGHLKISCGAMAKLAVRFLESTAKSSSVAVRFLPRCKNKA